MERKKLYVKTYGCQMNVYDSMRMADMLKPLGYDIIDSPQGADMAILNTCHIREKAEEKLYSDLGRIKPFIEEKNKQGSDMVVAVAGCVAQAEGAEIMRRAPYVDIVMGSQAYHRLPEMVAKATRAFERKNNRGRGIVDIDFPVDPKFDLLPEVTGAQNVSAFLSVQEGCDRFCTYCVVVYTRGAEYSRPVATVLSEAKRLVELGAKELTLLGQNVNAYHGEDEHGNVWGLAKLIEALAKIDGLERIRYTTSHPRDMTDDLIAVHRDIDKLMPYLHLPVQSGSDIILEAMNRQHKADDYRRIIERVRNVRPDIALSSDFIVGFPGESDKDFQDTLKLVEDIDYAQAYSFKYSPRPGTPAALLETQIAEEIKEERLAQLQLLLSKQQEAFNKSFVGKTIPILCERSSKKDGFLNGKSPYLQTVNVKAHERLIGTIIDAKVFNAGVGVLNAEIVTQESILNAS